jgi:hypothetical protein
MVVVRLAFHKTIEQSRLRANKGSHFFLSHMSPFPLLTT